MGWASVRGFLPTGISQRLVNGEAVSSEATVFASLFTTDTRDRVVSITMVLERVGLLAGTGWVTV